MRIILTGSSGLIGSRFTELMFENHEIIPLSSKDATITVDDSVEDFFKDKNADILIHLAAKTDVDGCENDKYEDKRIIKKNIGEQNVIENMSWNISDMFGNNGAFAVNFYGTRNIYRAAKAKGMKFIYVSTDFVFAGHDKYNEVSKPDPINWYGMTKWYGEKLIDKEQDLIVRLSFPYGYPSPVKPDFIQKIISLLRDRDEVSLIEDQTITPTFIDDIVFGLDFLLQNDAVGIYHLTGSSHEDPYHIGQMVSERLGFNTKINPTTRKEFYKDKAPRPFQSIMLNDKIRNLGFVPKKFSEGLELIISKK